MFSFTFIFSKLFYPQPKHKRGGGSESDHCLRRGGGGMEASAACKLGLDERGSLHGHTTPNDFGGENGLLTSEARGGLSTNGNVTINNGNVLFV